MFARSFLIVLWLLICLTLVSGQDPKSKAQKLFAEAEELFNKNTPEASAEAAPKYAEALKLWQELGDEKQQIQALNKLVEIHASSGDYAKSRSAKRISRRDESAACFKLERIGRRGGVSFGNFGRAREFAFVSNVAFTDNKLSCAVLVLDTICGKKSALASNCA